MGGQVCEKCESQFRGRGKLCKDCTTNGQTDQLSDPTPKDLQQQAEKNYENLCALIRGVDDKLTAFNVRLTQLEEKSDKMQTEITQQSDNIIEVKKDIEGVQKEQSDFRTLIADVQTTVRNAESAIEDSNKSHSDKIDALSEKCGEESLKIVLKNVPENENENVTEKVNNIIHEGVNLQEVTVTHAERKAAFRDGYPGVIVAKCTSGQHKQLIMKNKSALKNKDQYKDIHIDSHKSYDQRKLESNLRTIVNAIGTDKLSMRGNNIRSTQHHNGNGANNNATWPTLGRGGNSGRGRGGGRGRGRGNGRGGNR